MFDPEFVKWIATLGVGGILAGFMFGFYRKDIKQFTELWKHTAEQMMIIIKENTASNVKLIHMIEEQRMNQIRRSDLAILKQRMEIVDPMPSSRAENHGESHG
jgi:hypothetical protein